MEKLKLLIILNKHKVLLISLILIVLTGKAHSLEKLIKIRVGGINKVPLLALLTIKLLKCWNKTSQGSTQIYGQLDVSFMKWAQGKKCLEEEILRKYLIIFLTHNFSFQLQWMQLQKILLQHLLILILKKELGLKIFRR